MITGDILNAIQKELLAFTSGKGATVLFKSDYRANKLPSYTMPLILLDVPEAPDTTQYMGGATRVDMVIHINTYVLSPDVTLDDPGTSSNDLLNFIDQVRQYFSFGVFSTQEMTDILTNYGFRFTLGGIDVPDALDQDGQVKGYRIMMDSWALDTGTVLMKASSAPLATVKQIDNPPFTQNS